MEPVEWPALTPEQFEAANNPDVGAYGQLLRGAPEPALAWYLMAEMGQGCLDIYGVPFLELPLETSAPILALLESTVPFRLWYLKEIAAGIKSFTERAE